MAGIINIIYKQEKTEGFNGEFGLSYALGELTTRRADLPTDLGRYRLNSHLQPNASLTYRSGKFSTFLQGSVLAQRRLPNNEFTQRNYTDGRRTISQVRENREQVHYVPKGGFDYAIDERNTLSVSGIYDYEHHIDTAQIPFIDLNTGRRHRYWQWKEDESTGFINGRADLRHAFRQPGHALTLAAQFTRGKENEQYFLNDSTRFRRGADTSHLIAIERTTASVYPAAGVEGPADGHLPGGARHPPGEGVVSLVGGLRAQPARLCRAGRGGGGRDRPIQRLRAAAGDRRGGLYGHIPELR